MPVMKQLRIGSATYDTVGEASVTQVQTSGTKIATVTIDGTATDLYAPEGGGGGPEPSSTTPAMDGTAAVGTATTYARADHVHPTDTSRQATLVSGTNIKTVNGRSLVGSGNISIAELPSVSSAHNGMVLMVANGAWVVQPLPVATDSQYGVVMVDGTTITANGGVISTAGGSTASEVTVTLTNPRNASEFRRVVVSESDTQTGAATDLGTITSPTGSGTYTVEKPYLQVAPFGVGSPWIDESSCTCTGGVAFDSSFDGTGIFLVTGDGTVTISGLDYDG